MSLQKLILNQASYNLWVNQQYVNWLKNKPKDLFQTEIASSYPSLYKTLSHILDVQEYWISIITGMEYQFPQEERSLDTILDRLERSSQQLVDVSTALTEEQLHEKIEVKSPWFEANLPCYEYFEHTIHHGFYHRGQLVTIGRILGITDAPMTDYNFYNIAVMGEAA
ncbi:MAG: damage-inducible protein DinB [Pedobacter sp.]|nr:MAG: damage-inducible protein DinB [Pedobacter sp.]